MFIVVVEGRERKEGEREGGRMLKIERRGR